MSLMTWPEWLWFPADWLLTVCMGLFLAAAFTYISSRPKKLKEGTTLVFSFPDIVSMTIVLVWSAGLLVAPIVWLVKDGRLASIPVLVLLALVTWWLIRGRVIRDLSRVETAIVVGIPLLVIIDLMIGVPEALEGLSLYAALVGALSVFVAFTAGADQDSSKLYHHKDVRNVVTGAQWLLRGVSALGLLKLADIARSYIDEVTTILIIVDVILVSLLIAVFLISSGESKLNIFRKER